MSAEHIPLLPITLVGLILTMTTRRYLFEICQPSKVVWSHCLHQLRLESLYAEMRCSPFPLVLGHFNRSPIIFKLLNAAFC